MNTEFEHLQIGPLGVAEANCAKHGEYVTRHLFGKIWTQCTKCVEESYAFEKSRVDVELKEEKRKAWENRIGQAGIPDRFRDRSLDSFAAENSGQQMALEVCKRYAENFDQVLKRGSCILMCGKPGTGKTHLAVAIGQYVMEHFGKVVLFTTVMKAIRTVKETYGRDSAKTEAQAIGELVYPDLLILDEVGVQFGTDAEKLIMFDVLNERYEKRRPTIFLSNKDLDGIKGYLGERIYDRLREDGSEYVSFTWESYRGQIK